MAQPPSICDAGVSRDGARDLDVGFLEAQAGGRMPFPKALCSCRAYTYIYIYIHGLYHVIILGSMYAPLYYL